MVMFHFWGPGWQIIPRSAKPSGFVFLALSALLATWSVIHFRRHKTTTEPFGTPTALVTSGPYQISRNPMYTSQIIALIGFALLMGSVIPFILLVLFPFGMSYFYIRHEERKLQELFGDEFRNYSSKVGRWFRWLQT